MRIIFLGAGCFFFLVLLSFNVAAAASPTSFSFDFSDTSGNYSDLQFHGDAAINGDLVDLTSASRNRMGRMFYGHPVQFYDDNTGEVASFATRFTFAMKFSSAAQRGNGMAFFLTPYTDIGNQTMERLVRFIAVEFDTNFNPNGGSTASSEHIAIDLSSWTPVSMTNLPRNSLSGTMTATITFDGSTRMLEASLQFDPSSTSLGVAKVKTQLPEPINGLLASELAVGMSASGSANLVTHQILSWSFNSTIANKDSAAQSPKAAEAPAAALPPTSFSFDFSDMSKNYSEDLRFEGDAALNGDLIDLTSSSTDPAKNIFRKGRMSYSSPVRFYDNSTGEVASFATRFTFAIKLNNGAKRGDGMAFFLAAYPSELPPNSAGSLIGLIDSSNQTLETIPKSCRFIAVEFDTYFNPNWEPTASSDHIGIDLSSVTSVSTTNLPRNSLSGTMTAIITFDGSTRMLEASLYFDPTSSLGVAQVKTQLPEPINGLLPPEVAVGFSAGTGAYFELHQILSWSFKSTAANKDSAQWLKDALAQTLNSVDQPNQDQTLGTKAGGRRRRRQTAIIGGAGVPAAAAVVAAIWSAVSWFKWKGVRNSLLGSTTGSSSGVKRFEYSDLIDATGGFSDESKIQSDSGGSVYKGSLRDDDDDNGGGSGNKKPVAVKKIVRRSRKGAANKDFMAVLDAIARTKHANVVRLEGWGCGVNNGNQLLDFMCWCLRRRSLKLFLVYELVPAAGNLHEHLHQMPDVLSWPKRYKIVKGIASGLHYLHHEFEECILHGDIRPSNIFLDHDFNAKLGYFGLSRMAETTSNAAAGTTTTTAYTDPVSKKDEQVMFRPSSDIYSFGIVLLEIAHGANNPKLVRRLHESQPDAFVEVAADKKLADRFDRTEMERVIVLGLLCSEPDEKRRPSMVGAMRFLEKGGDLRPAATPDDDGAAGGGGIIKRTSEACALIFPSVASDMYRSPDQGV